MSAVSTIRAVVLSAALQCLVDCLEIVFDLVVLRHHDDAGRRHYDVELAGEYERARDRQYVGGASLGGPILKDKLFYLLSVDGQLRREEAIVVGHRRDLRASRIDAYQQVLKSKLRHSGERIRNNE